MLNRVVLVGRITRDPELRYTQTGIPVVSFSLAVDSGFNDQQGERKADFFNCVAWRNNAENMAKFIKKGALLGIDGRLQSRTYQTQTGENRYVVEVVCDTVRFLEPRGTRNEYESNYEEPVEEDPLFDTSMDIASEDDLPF